MLESALVSGSIKDKAVAIAVTVAAAVAVFSMAMAASCDWARRPTALRGL